MKASEKALAVVFVLASGVAFTLLAFPLPGPHGGVREARHALATLAAMAVSAFCGMLLWLGENDRMR